jgi:predicted transcriptional regulator
MSRPSLGKVKYTHTMPPELLERVDELARSLARTRSDVIEEAVRKFVQRKAALAAREAKVKK